MNTELADLMQFFGYDSDGLIPEHEPEFVKLNRALLADMTGPEGVKREV